jgi:hypothetical protein
MKDLLLCAAACILSFSVNAKSTIVPAANDSLRFIKLQLIKNDIHKDETVIIFKNKANPAYDMEEDSRYFQGNGLVRLYSFVTKTDPMVFNTQPFPSSSSVTRLHIFARTDGQYRLKLSEIMGVPGMFNIWLVDNLSKDSIDLKHNTDYSFNVSKADTNSFGGNRFKVVVKKDTNRACRLLSLKVDKITNSKKTIVKWRAENESNNTVYTLERSMDKAKTFAIVDSLVSDGKGNYSIADNAPVKGINIYRLKQRDVTDMESYSENLQVNNDVTDVPIVKNSNIAPAVYPNPVNNLVNVTISNKLPAGVYTIAITNIWGLKIKEATTNGQQWQSEVSDLKPGMYMVTVTSKANNKIVGYNKFLKN